MGYGIVNAVNDPRCEIQRVVLGRPVLVGHRQEFNAGIIHVALEAGITVDRHLGVA